MMHPPNTRAALLIPAALLSVILGCGAAPLRCDPLVADLYDHPQGGTGAVLTCALHCRTWECTTDPKSRLVTCCCDGKAVAEGESWSVQ